MYFILLSQSLDTLNFTSSCTDQSNKKLTLNSKCTHSICIFFFQIRIDQMKMKSIEDLLRLDALPPLTLFQCIMPTSPLYIMYYINLTILLLSVRIKDTHNHYHHHQHCCFTARFLMLVCV